ncbi:MAG: hypothetical protein JXA30_18525 [Deltaproteobacteria bacterium]|nr:hypothetical protein [Deltaproteobacteria bacterium]
MVRALPDEPARERKPVLRDELAAVVVKQRYPPERLRSLGHAKCRHDNHQPSGLFNSKYQQRPGNHHASGGYTA